VRFAALLCTSLNRSLLILLDRAVCRSSVRACGAAREGEPSYFLCAAPSLPARRLRDVEIVSPYLKDRLEFEGLRRRHVGRPDPQRVRTLKRVKSWPKSIGVRADSPTRTWTRCSRNRASINSSSWGSAHILVWSRPCDFAAELGY